MSELMRDCATRRRWGKNTHGESCPPPPKVKRGEGEKKILECEVGDGRGKETRESIPRKGGGRGGELSDFS